MVSSRDRVTVSVEDRLALSAEHRRLRFSFQINDVKDPTGLPVPPFFARWRRGRAYLFALNFRVNLLLVSGSIKFDRAAPGRKTRSRAAEGLPSSVRKRVGWSRGA